MELVISNIDGIKNYIKGDVDTIINILESADYHNLKYENYTGDIRGGHSPYSNRTSLQVNVNTLVASLHSKGIYGDIFTVLEYKLGDFISSLNLVKRMAGISDKEFELNNNKNIAWGCWWDNIDMCESYSKLNVYDTRLLEQFKSIGNKMFRQDNIDLGTQRVFNIGFDFKTNRITIPHYSLQGELIGVVGRLNLGANGIAKYLPLIPDVNFPRKHVLFGAYQNKEYIKNRPLFIFESEKSVMQMYSYGLKNCVALGGKRLYEEQIIKIEKLNPSFIVLALDEDVDKEYIKKQCETLKLNMITNRDIYYLHDKDKEYLKEGSKHSPSDLGLEIFKSILKECLNKY